MWRNNNNNIVTFAIFIKIVTLNASKKKMCWRAELKHTGTLPTLNPCRLSILFRWSFFLFYLMFFRSVYNDIFFIWIVHIKNDDYDSYTRTTIKLIRTMLCIYYDIRRTALCEIYRPLNRSSIKLINSILFNPKVKDAKNVLIRCINYPCAIHYFNQFKLYR